VNLSTGAFAVTPSSHTNRNHPLTPWIVAIAVVFSVGGSNIVHGGDCPALLPGFTSFGTLNRPPYLVAVANGLAYTADRFGLSIYDVHNQRLPSLVGEIRLSLSPRDLAVEGKLVCLTTGDGELLTVDVSDPAHPEITGSVSRKNHGFARIAVSGQTVYAADSFANQMAIIDVSDPSNPTILSIYQGYTEPYEYPAIQGVAVSGNFAYLSGIGSFGGAPTLQIVDVSDPSHPKHAGEIDLDGASAIGIAVAGGVAYLGVRDLVRGTSPRLQMIRVSDPRHPVVLGSLETSSAPSGIVIQNRTAYFTSGDAGLLIVDVSSSASPSLLGSYTTTARIWNVAVSGNTAYVAAKEAGFQTVSVSDPRQPRLLEKVDTSGWARDVTLANGLAYVADGGAGLQVVDYADPANPVLVGGADTPGYAYAVVVSGELAYVADGEAGLAILDLSERASPVLVGNVGTPGSARAVAISEHLAYAACGDAGFQVIDVSDPANPWLLGSLETPGYAHDIALSGPTAYIADWYGGIEGVDVSDPTNPRVLGRYKDDDLYALGITVSRDVAYVANGASSTRADSFLVFDISDPRHPHPIGSLDTSGSTGKPAVAGNTVFVLDGQAGLEILDLTDPTNPTLVSTVSTRAPALAVAIDRAAATAVLADGVMVEAATLACPSCAGMEVEADPETVVRAGYTSRITARVYDLAGRPAPGATVTGEATMGTLSAFQDNGDGSYTATLTSDDRSGNAEVTVTVDGTPCSRTLVVPVLTYPDSPAHPYPGDFTYIVPAVAHTPGANGTSWVSELFPYNGSDTEATVSLYFLQADTDSTGAQGHRLHIPPHAALKLEDVVSVLFGHTHTSGAVIIGSDRPLVITSRTYNDTPSGTFGQFVAGVPLDEATRQGQTARLIQLTRNADYRTNIGFANTADRPLLVGVQLFDAGGHQIGTRRYSLEAASFHQANDIFGGDVADGYAVVWSSGSSARYFAYASVIDNRTGDPIFVTSDAGTAYPRQTLFIPAAAHVDGTAGTHWRTDLEIQSTSSHAADCTIELLERDRDNSSTQSRQITVERETSRRMNDVLDSSFGFTGSGALRIGLSSGAIVVASRTYNQGSQGTFGQFITSVREDSAVKSGKTAVILQLAESTSTSSGYRSNIGLVNTSANEISVKIDLFDGDGTSIGALTVGLPPHGYTQVDRIIHRLSWSDHPNSYALLRTDTPGGAFFAYGSVIDNRSGDAIYVPAVEVPQAGSSLGEASR